MKFSYDSNGNKSSVQYTEKEKNQEMITLDASESMFLTTPIARGLCSVLVEYISEVCDDIPSMKEKGRSIVHEIAMDLDRLFLPNSFIYLRLYIKKIGLPKDYFAVWLKENAGADCPEDFARKFDYLDDRMPKIGYTVTPDEICIFLYNEFDRFELRRFNPRTESIDAMCDQAWIIASDAIECVCPTSIQLRLDDNGRLINSLKDNIIRKYKEAVAQTD